MFQNSTTVDKDEEEEQEMYLRKASPQPVQDRSMLHEPLKSLCKGKNLYWLEQAPKGNQISI